MAAPRAFGVARVQTPDEVHRPAAADTLRKALADHPGTQGADDLRAALDAGEPADKALEGALHLVEDVYWSGELERAIELVDAVRACFPKARRFLGQMVCLRADACREVYRYDDALSDLELAASFARRESDAITLFYIAGARMQVYLDLGLLAPATDACREMESQRDLVLDGVSPETRPMYARGLGLEVARRRYLLAQDGLSYDEAFEIADAVLRDETLFPSTAGAGTALREAEAEFLARRGIAACGQARNLRALERDAADTLATARADLERALEGHLVPAIKEGLIGFEEALKALLALAHVARQLGDRPAEDEALSRLDAILAAFGLELNPSDMARRIAFLAQRRIAALHSANGPLEEVRLALRADEERLAEAYSWVERAWMLAPRAPEGIGFLHAETHVDVLATWMQAVIGADPFEGPRAALAILARAQAVATIAQRRGGGGALLEDAAQRLSAYLSALPPGSGVIAFLPAMETSFVFAADADRVVCREIAPRTKLRDAVGRLSGLVERPPPKADDGGRRERLIRTAAGAVSEQLFPADVRERLATWRRVQFVGAELLGRPVLESATIDGRALAETHATSYLPGLAIADVLAREWRPADAGVQYLLLAGPKRDDELSLELGPGFLKTLRSRAGNDAVRVGDDASAEAMESLLRSRPDVLAVVAHGAYDAELARPAQIALALGRRSADGMLTCAGLEELAPDLPTLVLFLTCGSAVGPVAPGDAGVADLGGAALLGGAEAALVATTDVALEVAEIALPILLERLSAGDPPDEALRVARLAVVAAPGFEDPFFAYSLRLFGVAHLPLAQRSEVLRNR